MSLCLLRPLCVPLRLFCVAPRLSTSRCLCGSLDPPTSIFSLNILRLLCVFSASSQLLRAPLRLCVYLCLSASLRLPRLLCVSLFFCVSSASFCVSSASLLVFPHIVVCERLSVPPTSICFHLLFEYPCVFSTSFCVFSSFFSLGPSVRLTTCTFVSLRLLCSSAAASLFVPLYVIYVSPPLYVSLRLSVLTGRSHPASLCRDAERRLYALCVSASSRYPSASLCLSLRHLHIWCIVRARLRVFLRLFCLSLRLSASLPVSLHLCVCISWVCLRLFCVFLRFSASLFSTSLFEYPCVFASFCVFSKLLLCTSWALCASHYVYIRLSASSLLLCSGVSLRLYVSLRLSASRGISVHLFVPLRLSAPSTSLCVSLGVTPLSTMSVRHLHIWYIVRLLCISWCLLRPLCISRCHLRLSVDTKRRRLSEKSV